MTSIYFLDERPADAIADWDSNSTFVGVAQHLKDKGIKNHDFMILLLNPELKGVDPFDPDLSDELKIKVTIEARDNPFYFVRSCLKVRTYNGELDPTIGDLASVSFWWLYGIGGYKIAREQIRQSRKHWNSLALLNWIAIFSPQPQLGYVLSKDDMMRRHIALSFMEQYTPDYIRDVYHREDDTLENYGTTIITNEYSRVQIQFQCAQESEKRAMNQGRGLTTPHVTFNDAAYYANINVSLPSVIAATHAASTVAETKNIPHGIVINTSAGKKSTREGKYVYDLINQFTDWDDSLYDLDRTELKFITRGVVRIPGTYDRVGMTYEQVLNAAKMAGIDPDSDEGKRDYFNIWTD